MVINQEVEFFLRYGGNSDSNKFILEDSNISLEYNGNSRLLVISGYGIIRNSSIEIKNGTSSDNFEITAGENVILENSTINYE